MLALDGVDITQRSVTDRTYFDIAGRTAGVVWPTARRVHRRGCLAPRDRRVGPNHVRGSSAGGIGPLDPDLRLDDRGRVRVRRVDDRRDVGVARGARNVSPVVRAARSPLSSARRRRHHVRLGRRASRTLAARARARDSTSLRDVEHYAAGVDRARRRHVLARAGGGLSLAASAADGGRAAGRAAAGQRRRVPRGVTGRVRCCRGDVAAEYDGPPPLHRRDLRAAADRHADFRVRRRHLGGGLDDRSAARRCAARRGARCFAPPS